MTEETQEKIRSAIEHKKGQEAYDLANAVLDEDEDDAWAWFYLMKTFELLLPVEQYQASNELTCGENAIECAGADEQEAMAAKVYAFYLEKARNVLELDEKKLSDAREIANFYQRRVYFDERKAASETYEEDRPLIDAVRRSFHYAFALFDGVDRGMIRMNRVLEQLATKLAHQWRRTYSYVEIRYEFYGGRLSDEDIKKGLKGYAHLLRDVADAESILEKPAPFNLFQWDQVSYLSEERDGKRKELEEGTGDEETTEPGDTGRQM